MDAVIERAKLSVDDAFLYEGRRRGYISVEALAALSNEQGCNSTDILNFGLNTGCKTWQSAGATSELGHYK